MILFNTLLKTYYIQSDYRIGDSEKLEQEERSFTKIKDSFKKVIITDNIFREWYTNQGTLILGIEKFLTDEKSLEL
jgi:hypothetical protein